MKKVCFYLDSLGKGGAQRVVVNLSEYLVKQGIEVTLITIHKLEEEYTISSSIKRVFSDLTKEEETGNRIQNFWNRLRKLRNILDAEQPEVVVSFIGKNNMMAIAASFFTKRKVLISVRAMPEMEYYSKAMRILSKTLFIKADGLILQTQDAKAYFPRLIQKKSVILPNPLNMEFVGELPEQDRRKEIVTVGRMDENKNQKILIEAFSKVAAVYDDWQLILYGDGPIREELIQYAGKTGYGDRIHFPGNVSDVSERLLQARIFVLPSNTEGMPNSLMEAMAMGLACVSTDCPCGGPKTLINTGDNGILFPVGDTKALERSLRSILEDEKLEQRLSRNALRIREDLHPDRVNKMWVSYMEEKL